MRTGTLRIEAAVEEAPQWPWSCAVAVRVVNAGAEPVVVNRRLAIGYREADSRELFAEVRLPEGGEPVSSMKKIYDRDLAAPEDYVPLARGEAIEGGFDLVRWYRLPGPGFYELVVFYQADEPLAPRIPGLVTGIHASAPVAFELGG